MYPHIARQFRLAIFLIIATFGLTDCSKHKSFSVSPTDSSASSLNDTISNHAVELGMNKFDLADDYVGKASGSDGSAAHAAVEKAMGLKSIIDGRNYGATFFRVAITGFLPVDWHNSGDLDLWLSNPDAYWAAIDQMMADLASHGMRIAPTFFWNSTQFAAMSNTDTLRDTITNPNSASYQLLVKYVTQFVSRYKDNPAIIFYELANELNLSADLDNVTRCKNSTSYPQTCEVQGNYTTDEMIAFMQRLADVIRSIDPNHPISSGNAFPRNAAEHMRAKPEFVDGSTDFTPDTMDQFVKNLGDVNSAADLVSVHNYNDEDRFGYTGADVLTLTQNIVTQQLHKKLYVGEYGNPNGAIPQSPGDYAWQVLDKINQLQIPYSSPWIFEFYQYSITNIDSAFHLEEGFSDAFLQHFQSISAQLGDFVMPQGADTTPPQVVITSPLSGTVVSPSQLLYAVASDDSGTVTRVDFQVDGHVVSSVTTPPYQMTLDTTRLTQGTHMISAVAYDPSGNMSTSTATVTANTGIMGSPSGSGPTIDSSFGDSAVDSLSYVTLKGQYWGDSSNPANFTVSSGDCTIVANQTYSYNGPDGAAPNDPTRRQVNLAIDNTNRPAPFICHFTVTRSSDGATASATINNVPMHDPLISSNMNDGVLGSVTYITIKGQYLSADASNGGNFNVTSSGCTIVPNQTYSYNGPDGADPGNASKRQLNLAIDNTAFSGPFNCTITVTRGDGKSVSTTVFNIPNQ